MDRVKEACQSKLTQKLLPEVLNNVPTYCTVLTVVTLHCSSTILSGGRGAFYDPKCASFGCCHTASVPHFSGRALFSSSSSSSSFKKAREQNCRWQAVPVVVATWAQSSSLAIRMAKVRYCSNLWWIASCALGYIVVYCSGGRRKIVTVLCTVLYYCTR